MKRATAIAPDVAERMRRTKQADTPIELSVGACCARMACIIGRTSLAFRPPDFANRVGMGNFRQRLLLASSYQRVPGHCAKGEPDNLGNEIHDNRRRDARPSGHYAKQGFMFWWFGSVVF